MRRSSIYAVLIAAVCLLIFAPAYTAGITNWDDDSYLRAPESQRISAGTFIDFVFGSFHPLTILSFAIEQQLAGRNPVLLHAINVVLHAITAVLVFLLLQDLTAMPFGAFSGALLWAIHPLRVESVVWIAARKDVLSGVFFVAALVAYVRRQLALTFALFVLALLSKGTAVTFPLAMLAIDYLQRRKALLEKIPFFVLSAIFGAIGYFGQRGPGSVTDLEGFAFSPLEKFVLSCQTVLFYLGKEILPTRLSAFYPYPQRLTPIEWLAPAIVIAIVVIVALTMRTTRAIAFAFAFFVVTIAIILPWVSIGHTIAADRFTYIPSIGLAYVVAVIAKPKAWPVVAIVAATLGVMTYARSRVWHDSISLWTSVIEVQPVPQAYNGRGIALAGRGQVVDAVRDLDRAIGMRPCYLAALHNRLMLEIEFGDGRAVARARDKLAKCQKQRP